jgi:thiol-disulfide isomerase/thioredoxin
MSAVRAVVAAVVLAAVLVMGLAACGTTPHAGAAKTTAPASSAVQACPAQPDRPAKGSQVLPSLTFGCLGGGRLDLGKAPGVPTVVNLWASWCGPCREELPLMQRLAAAGAGKVRVVGVVSKDGRPQAVSFAADAGATFPSAFDGQGDLMTKLGLQGLPYTYFLDADGAVAFTQVGPVTSEEQLRGLVADHLGVRL